MSVVAAVELALFAPFLYFNPGPAWDDIVFTMLPVILAVWLVLWFGLLLAGGYVTSLLVLACVALLSTSAGSDRLVDYFLTVLALMSIATTGLFLVRGIKRGLLRSLDWGVLAAVCISSLVVTAFFLWSEPADSRYPVRYLFISALTLGALLPVALPFVAAPVLIDWVRHR